MASEAPLAPSSDCQRGRRSGGQLRARRFEVPSALDPCRDHRSACARRAADGDGLARRCGRRTRWLRQDHLARPVGRHQRRPRLLARPRRSRQRSGGSAVVPGRHHEQDRASRSVAVPIVVGRGLGRHELVPAWLGNARVVAAASIRPRPRPHRIGDRPTLGDLLATVALNLPIGCRIAFASRVDCHSRWPGSGPRAPSRRSASRSWR